MKYYQWTCKTSIYPPVWPRYTNVYQFSSARNLFDQSPYFWRNHDNGILRHGPFQKYKRMECAAELYKHLQNAFWFIFTFLITRRNVYSKEYTHIYIHPYLIVHTCVHICKHAYLYTCYKLKYIFDMIESGRYINEGVVTKTVHVSKSLDICMNCIYR